MGGAQLRAELAERLRERRAELERAVLARVFGISDPAATTDPTYTEGLKAAVHAALDYGLEGVELGERPALHVPAALLVQARVAARAGVSLDTVLRRYLAGYTMLGDLVIEEAERAGLEGEGLKRLLRAQSRLLDGLLSAVSEEYRREGNAATTSAERARTERVRRLLAGELLEGTELAYDLEATHLGALATGPGASEGLRHLAELLDRRLLVVEAEEGTAWAWFGGRRGIDLMESAPRIAQEWPSGALLALGEPAAGLEGWRLTHRQAKAALPIALHDEGRIVRYADVALLATAFSDDLLATSLRHLYLDPLRAERDGGVATKATLRAYFACSRNVSSAATALGVSRRTVTARLRAVEETVGRSLQSAGAEIETALRLEGLAEASPSQRAS